MMTEELEFIESNQEESEEMPSLNHSIICADIAEQIYANKQVKALPELTLDIGKGITPDLCIYERDKIKADFWKDITRYSEIRLFWQLKSFVPKSKYPRPFGKSRDVD